MEITAYAVTDVGAQRDHNEDYMLSDPAAGLFVVCDGMGGHNAGEIASEMCAKTVQQVVAGMKGIVDAVRGGGAPANRLAGVLRTAIETACAAVYDDGRANPERYAMGCTCTAVLIAGGKAVMGHVGDSRLYLARGGTVTQLSEDHTFIAEAIKAGVFTPEEAEECGNKNVITRAIGKERTVMVDTLVFDLLIGDTLLLCSDGLHGYIKKPAELAEYLGEPELHSAAPARLVGLANQRGGSDNITAIAIRASASAGDEAENKRSDEAARAVETLRGIDLLKDLTLAEIVRFRQVFQEVSFAPGATVVREGEVNDSLFVICAGRAEVCRGQQEIRIAVLNAGTHFGEMSLLSSRPRSATVRAIEPCKMLTVSRERLYALLQQDGMLAAKFFWKLSTTLCNRLDDVLAQQAEMAQQIAQQMQGSGYMSGSYARPR